MDAELRRRLRVCREVRLRDARCRRGQRVVAVEHLSNNSVGIIDETSHVKKGTTIPSTASLIAKWDRLPACHRTWPHLPRPTVAKLASPQSEGGAAITFSPSPTAPGSARISINAENEVSFTIADAAGRTVMTGILHPADSATPNERELDKLHV